MDLVVEPMSEVPIYQQIRDRIVEMIAIGTLLPGDALTSVRALSKALGVNPATVVKAFDLLRHEGFVVTNRRVGTVIANVSPADPLSQDWTERLHTLLAEARARGASNEDILAACRDHLNFTSPPQKGSRR